ncbi:MAG: amidase [Alphaproteobacteria bacterium]|nr:amidase [Alphaproteobacteria bacterium]
MSEALTALDLVTVAERIRSRDVSAVEVTEACLARTQRLQPRLNAFIAIEPDRALAEARAADAALAAGRTPGPLHGVPLAHKDMFYRAGRVCTCGSKLRRDFCPKTTATVLSRLESAGAVSLGTLNMGEFAAAGTGHNPHYGDCHNPWHTDHITGGSSSGSGAAVAARLIYGALGSDTGGSVRTPAAMCGIVGLKPTYGLVSRFAAMPRSWTADAIGPLARTVRDCARLTAVIAGADAADPETATARVGAYEAGIEDSVRGLRVGVPTSYFYDGISADVEGPIRASLDVMRALGAVIVDVAMPDLDLVYALAQIMLKAEAAAIHEPWLRDRAQDYSVGVRTEVESGLLIPAPRYLEATRLRGPLAAEFREMVFGRVDVLHAPVFTRPVPRRDESNPDDPARAAAIMASFPRCNRPVNYLGLPSLAVPCGFAGNGLPVGFQLIGRPYAEDLLFRLGHLYQRETGWHRMAPDL